MSNKTSNNGPSEKSTTSVQRFIPMNGHHSDIRTRKTEKPVATHFCQPDHSLEDLEVRGIEIIHNNSTQWRRERESFWIFTLRTLAPDGMNLDE